MFESKEEIGAAVDLLWEIAGKLNRGDVFTHADIQEVLGLRPHEGRYDYIVKKVCKRLVRERKIATWPEVTVGYKLLTKKEQLEDLPRWRMQKSSAQLRRFRTEAPMEESLLTVNERRKQAANLHMVTEAHRQLKRQLREHSILIRPTETLPRRPVAARH